MQRIGNVKWSTIISTPQLFTTSINDFPSKNFVIVTVPPKEPVDLIFETAIVRGSVYPDQEFENALTRISNECVRRGSTTEITGTKTFSDLLSINAFLGEFVDYPTTENFVLNNNAENKFNLDCTKKFESITISGDVVFGGDNLILTHWNGINLLEFFQNAVKINQPTRLDALAFTNIKATNLALNQINNRSFAEIVSSLENSVGHEGNLSTVHINGNINIGNLLVDSINGNNFNNYLDLVVTKNSDKQIGGVKRFLAGLRVINLSVRRINSVDIDHWLENALHKHKQQFIGESWTLATVTVNDMKANMINNLKAKELIDLSVDAIEIRSDIRIKSLEVFRNLNGAMACDVRNMIFVLDNGPTKMNWNYVSIEGYARWPENEGSPINELLQFAVTGTDQIITGDVTFANNTSIDDIQSTGIINNVDVRHIIGDCLVKRTEHQIIKGTKSFKEAVNVASLSSDKDLRTQIINGVDVLQLNNSIVRLSEANNIISGVKTFVQPLKSNRLTIDGLINGVPVNDIVFVNSTIPLPPISFQNPILIQKDLIIAYVNEINFNDLINNIIRKAGPPQESTGWITFENLVVLGDTKIPSINNIDINDVVLKSSDSMQEINAFKAITGDLYIDGPAIITTINDVDVVNAYDNTIFLDQKMVIRRLELMNEAIVHKGVRVISHVNDISIVPLIGWKPPSETDLAPLWSNVGNIINEADRLIHQNYGQSFHILYLDYAANIKVKYETVNNHPVSFIVDTVDSGELCGLDHKCDCPAQYDISLSFYQIFINRRPYGDRQLKMIGLNCNVTVKTNFLNKCTSSIPTQTVFEWSAVGGLGSLTITEAIFGVKLYEVGNDIFMLVNHINGSIIAMKYDHQANNWFTSDVIRGNNIHMDVLEWKSYKVLIVLSRPSEINNHDVARLWFYNTDVGRQGFEMYHEIPGEYNLCSKLYMWQEEKFVLFLSKSGSQFVTVFMVHWHAQFQLFQTLTLNSGIKTFTSFTVDGKIYCILFAYLFGVKPLISIRKIAQY